MNSARSEATCRLDLYPRSLKYSNAHCNNSKIFQRNQVIVKPIACVYWSLERFSFECRKVIGFAFTTLRDWLKKLAPLFRPIRSKTTTNRDSPLRVFPRFASATCNYFAFWLVHLIICALCDCLEWLLWFWFYDTQLKTALLVFIGRERWVNKLLQELG